MLNSIKYYTIIILSLITFLQSGEPLSIGFWNVENLFDLENDPNKNDDEFAIGGKKNVNQEIYEGQCLFKDVDNYLSKFGFEIFELERLTKSGLSK